MSNLLAKSRFGRIALHLICLAQDGKWGWHWIGIHREFHTARRHDAIKAFLVIITALFPIVHPLSGSGGVSDWPARSGVSTWRFDFDALSKPKPDRLTLLAFPKSRGERPRMHIMFSDNSFKGLRRRPLPAGITYANSQPDEK